MAIAELVENVDLAVLGLAEVMVGEGEERGMGLSLILGMQSPGVDGVSVGRSRRRRGQELG